MGMLGARLKCSMKRGQDTGRERDVPQREERKKNVSDKEAAFCRPSRGGKISSNHSRAIWPLFFGWDESEDEALSSIRSFCSRSLCCYSTRRRHHRANDSPLIPISEWWLLERCFSTLVTPPSKRPEISVQETTVQCISAE